MQLLVVKSEVESFQDAVILNGCVIFCDYKYTKKVESMAKKLSGVLGLKIEVYIKGGDIANLSWNDTVEILKSRGVITCDQTGSLNNDVISSLVDAVDQYKTLCVSTAHLTPDDMEAIEVLAKDIDCNMITGRDTGFFVKLYEEPEYNKEYSGCSDHFHHILISAFNNGYRMVEFDSQAEKYDYFPLFDW
jgi:hypothetical protein